MKKLLLLTLSSCLLIIGLPATAAGTKPVLNINCGQIVGGIDENGTYGLFKPDVTVRYYGSPLKVTAFYYPTPNTPKSEAGQTIVTFTNKYPSTRFLVSKVDIERKILEYSQPQTGYYKILFEAVDTLKRKGSFSCLYKDYYFSTALQGTTSGGLGSGGFNSRGFNKSNCTFNGKKLYGSVYFTSSSVLADFKVYSTNSSILADLSVYFPSSSILASSCGNWYRTSSSILADFTVYLTSSSILADFTIYPTNSSILAGT
jgi:hypothetical protein